MTKWTHQTYKKDTLHGDEDFEVMRDGQAVRVLATSHRDPDRNGITLIAMDINPPTDERREERVNPTKWGNARNKRDLRRQQDRFFKETMQSHG